MTTEKHIRLRRSPALQIALALLVFAVLAGFAARTTGASQPPTGLHIVSRTHSTGVRRWTYGWPVKPFDRQHPVRAFLNDPRIGDHGSRAFHFGIDISAPDGTAVYAVEAGTVYFDSPCAIAVVAPDRSRAFGYWHIVPAVKNHQYVARHQLIGWIGKGWGHVHFAEHCGDEYVNPLRPGGLGPYTDRTAPIVTRVVFGRGAVIVEAHDSQSPPVPGAWRGEPLTPALLRWRVRGSSEWHTIVDFRTAMLPRSEFDRIYASGTLQNHKGVPGRFRFYLARSEQARALERVRSAIEIEAGDIVGNRTVVEWLNV